MKGNKTALANLKYQQELKSFNKLDCGELFLPSVHLRGNSDYTPNFDMQLFQVKETRIRCFVPPFFITFKSKFLI